MKTMTDEQLMAHYVETGDESAFEELHGRYQRYVVDRLTRYIPVDSLNDVSQNVWIEVCRSSSRFDSGRPFRPWLFRIIQRTATDFVRNRYRDRLTFQSDYTGSEPVAEADETIRTSDLGNKFYFDVCGLPEDHHELVVGMYYRGKSIRHMAHEMGLSRHVVFRLKREALRQLRSKLGHRYRLDL